MISSSQGVIASTRACSLHGEARHQLGVANELVAQSQHGFGVDLRYALLRDLQDPPDLLQCQLVVIVEGYDQLLPLGQGIDRLRQSLVRLAALLPAVGILAVTVGSHLAQRRTLPASRFT